MISLSYLAKSQQISFSVLKHIVSINRLQSKQCHSLTVNENENLPADRKLDFEFKSLSARGYLRSQKPYTPPKDVSKTIMTICQNYELENGKLTTSEIKFQFLNDCAKALNHRVSNSTLHSINHIDDVITFYETPVIQTFPLDQMKEMDLPKNLHVLYEYTRFHPETDEKFNGISAFPESSTIMSNLRSKKKYQGYTAKKRSL